MFPFDLKTEENTMRQTVCRFFYVLFILSMNQ